MGFDSKYMILRALIFSVIPLSEMDTQGHFDNFSAHKIKK